MRSHQSGSANVLLIGDVMRDVIVKPTGPLRRGSDRDATIELKPGGSASNQAVWLAACGLSPKLIARVGSCDIDDLRAQFAIKGVDACLVADPDLQTGVLVALVHEDGERSFYTDRGANLNLCPGDVPQGVLKNTDMLVLSGYSFFAKGPRSTALKLMSQARELDIPVAIDPASKGFLSDVGVENFISWTRGASILFPNSDEAEILCGETEPEAQIRALGEIYELVVLTRGEEGASAGGRRGEIISVLPPKVQLVDTTGAGDAFAAGFLAKYLNSNLLHECLENGVAVGSRAVTQMGGQPEGDR